MRKNIHPTEPRKWRSVVSNQLLIIKMEKFWTNYRNKGSLKVADFENFIRFSIYPGSKESEFHIWNGQHWFSRENWNNLWNISGINIHSLVDIHIPLLFRYNFDAELDAKFELPCLYRFLDTLFDLWPNYFDEDSDIKNSSFK